MNGRAARDLRKHTNAVRQQAVSTVAPVIENLGDRVDNLEAWAKAFSSMGWRKRLRWLLLGR